ncbi:MAG: hypothetical protein ACMG6S_34470, partial [Byssovorax sp.]
GAGGASATGSVTASSASGAGGAGGASTTGSVTASSGATAGSSSSSGGCNEPEPDACPPFACPSPVQTLAGEACPTMIGQVCEGTGFCHYTCICKLDPATGAAAWECTLPPC